VAKTSVKRWLLVLGVMLGTVVVGRYILGGQSIDELHNDAIVVDGHVHITNRVFWEGIDPWEVQTTGLWDYARAREGGLDVVIAQVYLEDPYNNYNYAVKQQVRLVETFHRVLEANPERMELALSAADVRRIVGTGKTSVILALEGGFDMEGDLDVLRLFYRLGVRLIQFSNHNTTNAFADAGLGDQAWGGITDHGLAVIREMNRLGILIDISHASDAAQLQIIEASAAPVVASHHGLRRFSESPRTLSDDVLKAMAAKGGLVGIHSSAGFLSQEFLDWSASQPREPQVNWLEALSRSPSGDYGQYIAALDSEMRENWIRDEGGTGYGVPWRERQQQTIDSGGPLPTEKDWTDHVDHGVNLVGEDHVAIGMDMMSGGANIRDFDATSYPRLTEALVAKGYSPSRVRKILGENWLRVLDGAKAPSE
jgi:membrane dipeptidase